MTDTERPEGTAWKDKPYLKYYAEWTPHSLEYQDDTMAKLLDRTVAEHSSADILDFFGQTMTYGDFLKQVKSVAAGLRELGVRPGDRVAVTLPNCPQHLITIFAVHKLGGVVAEHNPLYTARELQGPCKDHGAKVAVVWDKIAPMFQELSRTTPLEKIVSVNMIDAMPLVKRLALKLPIKSIKEKRDQLHLSLIHI